MENIIQAILWDLDGVLIDSEEAHYITWKMVFKELGRELSHAEFKKTFGMNNKSVMQTFFRNDLSEIKKEEYSEKKELLFRENVKGNVKFLPGVKNWLKYFYENGIPQAMATSAPEANIEAIIREFPHPEYFQTTVSAEKLPGKPDPAVFLKAAGALNASPAQCLVFEDSVAGVKAAKAAGMVCIAITSTNPAEKLQEADLIIDTFDSLSSEQITGIFTRIKEKNQ